MALLNHIPCPRLAERSVVRRREFIRLLSGTAAAWPLAARAQRPAMPVIGFLGSESADLFASRLRAFHEGLGETGYVESRNVSIEYRWADGHNDRLPALAADLVRRQVAVIFANGSAAAVAKTATTMIPIVFYTASDPVETGLVASLNRPGGTLTGTTSLSVEVGPKRLELLHEVVPKATIIALLVNPDNPALAANISSGLQAAAHTLGLRLHILHTRAEPDFDAAFTTLVRLRADALVIGTDSFLSTRSEKLAALTTRHAVPAIFGSREFVAAGGLLSYGSGNLDAYRQAGVYTGRVLKGEKPAELPVVQSTKVELFINLKTAKALGITIPFSLLGRADAVIE